jgi:hypothetical protein
MRSARRSDIVALHAGRVTEKNLPPVSKFANPMPSLFQKAGNTYMDINSFLFSIPHPNLSLDGRVWDEGE